MSQVVKKFITDNAVDGAKARLDNAQWLRARNAANNADVNMIRVNASDVIEFAAAPQSSTAPSAGNDLTNKTYVDGQISAINLSDYFKKDGTVAATGDFAMGTFKITGMGDPTLAQDAATKAYVDAQVTAQKTWGYEALTLNGTDITNQYKDLAQVAVTDSIQFFVNGVWQRPTSDYTISYTGGAGGKTRLTFAGDLATGGGAALVSGDIIHIRYQY